MKRLLIAAIAVCMLFAPASASALDLPGASNHQQLWLQFQDEGVQVNLQAQMDHQLGEMDRSGVVVVSDGCVWVYGAEGYSHGCGPLLFITDPTMAGGLLVGELEDQYTDQAISVRLTVTGGGNTQTGSSGSFPFTSSWTYREAAGSGTIASPVHDMDGDSAYGQLYQVREVRA